MSKPLSTYKMHVTMRKALEPLGREFAWKEEMTKKELKTLQQAARKLEEFATTRLEKV